MLPLLLLKLLKLILLKMQQQQQQQCRQPVTPPQLERAAQFPGQVHPQSRPFRVLKRKLDSPEDESELVALSLPRAQSLPENMDVVDQPLEFPRSMSVPERPATPPPRRKTRADIEELLKTPTPPGRDPVVPYTDCLRDDFRDDWTEVDERIWRRVQAKFGW